MLSLTVQYVRWMIQYKETEMSTNFAYPESHLQLQKLNCITESFIWSHSLPKKKKNTNKKVDLVKFQPSLDQYNLSIRNYVIIHMQVFLACQVKLG